MAVGILMLQGQLIGQSAIVESNKVLYLDRHYQQVENMIFPIFC